ncbi:hypothetical protein COMA1_11531 [Candidatus Nitrospira nitrosa]|uniref:Uncharacterized protein n=1 Tax=Candidatus Nitrospira nitrosa TaxID=1742972 RepID=A0A0S4LBZ2_9BACT|nr:hypothetical protein COMA1_11531 [Candidatus Nitrospira nitrosa]
MHELPRITWLPLSEEPHNTSLMDWQELSVFSRECGVQVKCSGSLPVPT